jgi:hypothetical protein
LAQAVDLSAVAPSCAAILDNSDHVSEHCCTTRRADRRLGTSLKYPVLH